MCSYVINIIMLKSQYPKSPVQFSYHTRYIKMDFISWTHSSVPWLGRELPAVRLQMVLLRHGLGHGSHPRQDCGLTGADTVIQVLYVQEVVTHFIQ